MMRTSPRGIDDLVLSEALKTKAYRDSAGVWTIGVGHTASAGPPAPKAGMVITVQEAKDILARDLAKFEARVRKVLPNVPQHVFDGAVSFDFNTGQIHTASWVKHYKAGDMAQAEKNLKLWNKAGGKVLKGLVNRRQHEADLIFRGKYRSKPVAAPLPAEPASDKLKQVQARLIELGYYEVGNVDGLMGSRTRGALLAFKADNGLPLNDKIDAATEAALKTAKPRVVSPERANADEKTISDHAAIKDSNKVGLVAKAGGAVAVVGGLADTGILDRAEQIVGFGGRIKWMLSEVWDIVGPFWWIALLLAAVAIFLWVRGIKKEEVESYRVGETP